MLKRNITYNDLFTGEEVTETFYFNLTKTEIVDLEVEYEGGLERFLRNIIEAKDHKSLITEFKRIVLLSYGERSDDGKRFIKNDELREAFSQTAAFDSLFMELATDDKAAGDFIIGIVPPDLASGLSSQRNTLAPPAPPTQPQPVQVSDQS